MTDNNPNIGNIGNADSSVIHLISDILDRLIDTQSASAQSVSQMRDSVQQLTAAITALNQHFHNGFRSELKEHVTHEIKQLDERREKGFAALHTQVAKWQESAQQQKQTADETLEVLKELADSLKKPWFWIKVIGGILGSIAVIIAGILKLFNL